MRGSSWHACLGILVVFFLGFSFIHLCSSAPSSSRNNLLAFWNLCDQWTILRSLCQHPSEDLLSLSKVSPGFLVSFQFQGSDDIFATYFPPTRWCSGWGYSSQVRLGGKRSLKKSAYRRGDDVYLQRNPGFGDGEYSVQLVEWRPLSTFTMFCYVQTINEANFWRDTCVTVTGRHIYEDGPSWAGNYQILIHLCKSSSFFPTLYSLRRLLAFPMIHLSAFTLAYQFHSFNTVIWDRFQNN